VEGLATSKGNAEMKQNQKRRATFTPDSTATMARCSFSFPWVVGALFIIAAMAVPAQASSIFGTLSNFDTYNPTPEPAEGFEIELEGVHSSDITRTFPAHFEIEDIAEYSDSTGFAGVRIKYLNYFFHDSSGVDHFSVNPNANPQSTNGHLAVNMVDVEHFGFSLRGGQPTATRTYWLDKLPDGSFSRLNASPLPIPVPTWSYSPPAAPGDAAMVRAEIQVPEPEVVVQRPDSIWVKTFKTELDRQVDLDELMSGPGIVPQDAGEVEVEWELLEGGKMKAKDVALGENGEAVIRRYEYFEYTGPYDFEHQPTSPFLEDDTLDPVALGEVGDFFAANMVAANILVPEPSTFVLLLTGLSMFGFHFLRRSRTSRS